MKTNNENKYPKLQKQTKKKQKTKMSYTPIPKQVKKKQKTKYSKKYIYILLYTAP